MKLIASLLSIALVASVITVLSSCSPHSPNPTYSSSQNWNSDGSIVLARPIPASTVFSNGTLSGIKSVGNTPLLGFMPVQFAVAGEWLSIDRSKHTITLMSGAIERQSVSGEGFETLNPGVYSLLHKQRNPLWYAPDSYFEIRKLSTPAQGDRERYRRGALGDYALFIGQDIPLHSGPIWTSEIGGLRLSDTDISRLYYQLDVGAVIEVK